MIYSAHAGGRTALATGRVERRLAAILAADIAGYSRLMGADEEGTHERVKAHFGQLIEPKIKEHRGRIVKNTGDGLLAEFPSVVDALRCAVEIQHGMIDRNVDVPEDKRISFRIGVNLGDVIVEPEDIFGDGVNIAARLEALAEPAASVSRARSATISARGFHIRLRTLGSKASRTLPAWCTPTASGLTRMAKRRQSGCAARCQSRRSHCLISRRSRCCLSPISAAIRNRDISSMAWSRRSSPRCRASVGCSSSPEVRASPPLSQRASGSV